MKAKILRASRSDSIQDAGRFGYRALGVTAGGALDPFAAAVVNTLVGNRVDAAVIEITLGLFRLRCEDDRLLAWAGGNFSVRVGKTKIPAGRAFVLKAGEELEFAWPETGCRAWLAIGGGIEVPHILGSGSTDLRTGFGGMEGRALRSDDEFALGDATTECRTFHLSAPNEWIRTASPFPTLRIIPGIDRDLFSAAARRAWCDGPFTVTDSADRMGLRLEGPELRRLRKGDLLSEAVAPGTIQVPPNGQPILLLGDCQTVGGYPKIAHVITVDLPHAAQLRPADKVRFLESSLDEADALLRQRNRDFERFRVGLQLQSR